MIRALWLLSTIPLAWAMESPSITPRLAILPIESSSAEGFEFVGPSLTLALYAQELPGLYPFSMVREAYAQQGFGLFDQIPLASKIEIARGWGAEFLVCGTVVDQRLEVVRLHLPTRSVDRMVRAIDSDTPLGDLLEDSSRFLGHPIKDLPYLDDFYRAWATCYVIDDDQTQFRLLQTLLKRAQSNGALLDEYEEICGDPLLDLVDPDELRYWRDIYWLHARFYSAYRASTRLLLHRQGGDEYHLHAEILLALGKRELACQYARTALAYGLSPAPDDPCNACQTSADGETF